MADFGSLRVWLSLESSQFEQGLAKAKGGLIGWRDETNRSTSDMAQWGLAIGRTVAPFVAVGLAIKSTIDTAEKYQDEIQQFSYVTGMNTDQAQRWRAATIATDTDFGSFTYTMANLNARITSNTTDGEALRKTLTDMGVTVKDVNGDYVDADTLMKSLLESFDKMPSAQEKDAAAKEILGRSWTNLAEMINESGDALEAYDKASPGISQADLDKIDRFKTKWAEVAYQLDVVKAKVGLVVIDMAMPETSTSGGVMGAVTESRGTGGKMAINPLASLDKNQKKWTGISGDPFAGLSEQDAEIKYMSEVSIPELEKKLKSLQSSGTATYTEIASASFDLRRAKLDLIDLTTKEIDAQGDLTSAVETYRDALDAKEYSTQDYLENIQNAGGDMSKIRQLSLSHKQDIRAQDRNIAKAQASVSEAATNVKYGDVIVQVNGKDIVRVPGVAAGGISKEKRIQAGVPTAT
jgi:hypothetical protein